MARLPTVGKSRLRMSSSSGGLLLLPRSVVCFGMGLCLRIGGSLTFVVLMLLLDLLNRNCSSIFRCLTTSRATAIIAFRSACLSVAS